VHRGGGDQKVFAACASLVRARIESGVFALGVELLRVRDEIRRARDSETAHLEAILKDEGPKALRLTRLRDMLRDRGYGEDLDLQNLVGLEPRLWLDLSTCVVMRPDAGTYQLSVHGPDRIETILQTENLDDMVVECSRRLAHGRVADSRLPIGKNPTLAPFAPTTLIYVWTTGLVTGLAVFALCAILLKKLPF
jgi:hypothetical protein